MQSLGLAPRTLEWKQSVSTRAHWLASRTLVIIPVFALFLLIQILLHTISGAYKSELGGYPDEAAHFVTGLMVHDFIVHFDSASPIRFAEEFYVHYPKVALGHWPPVFYGIQAIWMVLFTTSRFSALLLNSFLTAIIASTIYSVTKKQVCIFQAFVAAILFMLFPLVQKLSGTVMAETPLTLFMFLSMYCFGMFLDNKEWKWSAWFSFYGILALLTKGNALALFVSIPGTLFVCRKYTFLRMRSFWVPFLSMCIPSLIWYMATIEMTKNGMYEQSLSIDYIKKAIPFYSIGIVNVIGLPLSLLALCGLMDKVIIPFWKGGAKGVWGALGSLAIGTIIFLWVIPAGLEKRHLMMALPPLAVFIGAGIHFIARNLKIQNISVQHKAVAIIAIVFLSFFAAGDFYVPKKQFNGISEVVRELCASSEKHSAFLISSDSIGEGIFVSEVAANESRPGKIVLRASKVLSTSLWSGSGYTLLYKTPGEVLEYLETVPVEAVVIDDSAPDKSEHQALLHQAMMDSPDLWKPLNAYDFIRDGILHPKSIYVYRRTRDSGKKSMSVTIDLSDMIGKNVHLDINR